MDKDWLDRLTEIWDDYRPIWYFLGVVLLIVGVIWACVAGVDAMKGADIAKRAEYVVPLVTTAQGRLNISEQTVASRRSDFLSYHSDPFDSQLIIARQRLGENGEAEKWLNQLTDAQNSKNWTAADEALKALEIIAAQDVGVVDRILGPPGTEGQGFYDELERQSRAVDAGLTSTVQAWITEVDQYTDLLSRKYLCGSTYTLTYSDAYNFLNTAQGQLDQANMTSTTQVEGMIDKPLVYQQATLAQASADQAKAEADGDNAGADLAPGQIASAEFEVTVAEDYVATHWYRLTEAKAALESARSEVQAAYLECYTADFAGVTAHVNSAISWADQAEWLATEPTPTPEPPPTPVPSSSGSSSWDTSSSDSSGSDSGSWDSSSSDSSSWDSSSSDSGSWDSGGSDSGSWDSGGSDSGSWDSGGSDDGSW